MNTKDVYPLRHEQAHRTHIPLFFVFSLVGCFFIMFCINRLNGHLEYEAGAKTGDLILPVIPLTFFVGVGASFFVVLISAYVAGLKRSIGTIFLVCGMAGGVAVAVDILSPLIGSNMYDSFLDGFKGRLTQSGVETNAINWANQIFTNNQLNTNKLDEIHFYGEQVPSFFSSLFQGSPEIIVYYGNDKTNAEQIEVRRSSGVDWGLLLVRNTNDLSGWQRAQNPRYCGNGLYVYVYFYK